MPLRSAPAASPSPAATPHSCPQCGAESAGRFCADCGAPLDLATCAGCNAPLTPGSRFCHRCGAAAGAAPQRASVRADAGSSPLPWAVAAIALVALIALVAGQRFSARTASTLDAPSNALPQAGLDFPAGAPAGGVVRGPDISSLSPEERAARLYDRVMRLNEEGQADSVQFFAPMAIQAYQNLPALDMDARYDMGRIAEVAGAMDVAKAQADSILSRSPTHLLGLILASGATRDGGAPVQALDYDRRLVDAAQAEQAKGLPEYQRHQTEITAALARARGQAAAP